MGFAATRTDWSIDNGNKDVESSILNNPAGESSGARTASVGEACSEQGNGYGFDGTTHDMFRQHPKPQNRSMKAAAVKHSLSKRLQNLKMVKQRGQTARRAWHWVHQEKCTRSQAFTRSHAEKRSETLLSWLARCTNRALSETD